MPTPMYLPKNPYILCSGIVVDSSRVESIHLTIRIKKEFEKTTNSNTLLATSNQTSANPTFQENGNNVAPSITPSPIQGQEAGCSPSPAPGPETPSDFALSQKIHATIDKVMRQMPASGMIVGERYGDFSLLLSSPVFSDLPRCRVEAALKTMLKVGDLKIMPNDSGLFAIAVHRRNTDHNDYDAENG